MGLCIEATLWGLVTTATITPYVDGGGGGDEPSGGGSTAYAVCTPSTAEINGDEPACPDVVGYASTATAVGNTTDVYMSVACPIDFITSCFSLGGWDDNKGWDDELGWQD